MAPKQVRRQERTYTENECRALRRVLQIERAIRRSMQADALALIVSRDTGAEGRWCAFVAPSASCRQFSAFSRNLSDVLTIGDNSLPVKSFRLIAAAVVHASARDHQLPLMAQTNSQVQGLLAQRALGTLGHLGYFDDRRPCF